MSITSRESTFRETAAYGGLIDAIGGLATVVIAIVGLSGVNAPMMASIATIVFGVALLIQGGAMLSEYAQIIFPAGSRTTNVEGFGGSSLSVVFLVGAAGIVLGVLSLLGIEPATLTPIAAIAFGSALVLSSNAVWQLHVLSQEVAEEQRSDWRWRRRNSRKRDGLWLGRHSGALGFGRDRARHSRHSGRGE